MFRCRCQCARLILNIVEVGSAVFMFPLCTHSQCLLTHFYDAIMWVIMTIGNFNNDVTGYSPCSTVPQSKPPLSVERYIFSVYLIVLKLL